MTSSFYPSAHLPFHDINLLVVTDVHSWIAGHGRHRQEHFDADYGDVLSFYQHLLKQQSHSNLFFVMNGDFMDGTGLSTIPPEHLTPLLQKMPWDALNVGNHELYFDSTVQHIRKSFVKHWNGTYLSSNTLWKQTQEPLTGHRYTFLRAKNSNNENTNKPVSILTFGFLYNFQGNCASTTVERVEDVVQQEWFASVLTTPPEPYHAILVLAHMDCVDPLVTAILEAIRQYQPTMPILFITGHSHRRAFARLDNHAASFEAGRFLDTIGFVSFPIDDVSINHSSATTTFDYRYLDANKQALYETLAMSSSTEFDTPQGLALTQQIQETQRKLGLNQVLGCADRTYSLEAALETTDDAASSQQSTSLWWLYLNEIIHKQLLNKVESSTTRPIFVQGTGSFRYSLLNGTITRDDVIAVCPFNDSIYEFDYELEGHQLTKVLDTLEETFGDMTKYSLPAFGVSPMPSSSQERYQLYLPDFEYKRLSPFIDNVTGTRLDRRSKIPKQVCLDSGGTTGCLFTTDLWMSHVKQEMPCQRHEPSVHNGDALLGHDASAAIVEIDFRDGILPNPSCMIAFVASFMLVVVFSFHLTASLLRKKNARRRDVAKMQGNDEIHLEDIGELLEDATTPLEVHNRHRGSYGAMAVTQRNDSVKRYSQDHFNENATALLSALHVTSNNGAFKLIHWELSSDLKGNESYLRHQTIEVSIQKDVSDQSNYVVAGADDEEIALEDPTIVVDDSLATPNVLSRRNESHIDMQWFYSIVYSETYCVPMLYFHVQFPSGEPCSRQRVLEILHHHQRQDHVSSIPDDTWEFLSQEQHPITNIPSFFLHPCQSSQRLQLLTADAKTPSILWTWMSMLLPAVGHPIPPPLFLKIQARLHAMKERNEQS